jgi:hypothetical protein
MAKMIKLSEVIEQLKEEIATIQNADDKKIFSLGEVTITAKFIIKTSGKAGGKFDLYAVTVDAGGALESQSAHELTIKLSPIEPVFMGKQKTKTKED